MARPLLSRKLDMIYLAFFIIHIPVIFLVDITPFYPAWAKPGFVITLREWYITRYRDRFFEAPPAFFSLFLAMEAVYHVPLSVWAVGALVRDDPRIPGQLLVFACQAGITTATCIAEYLSWDDFSATEVRAISALYVPYLALAVLMGLDMLARVNADAVAARRAVRGEDAGAEAKKRR